MGRVTEKHFRYRSKAEIVRDVAFVLNAPLKDGTQWAVLRDVAWVWTEFYGKYAGCPHWTKKARLQQLEFRKPDLRHEHVVPKNVVIRMLLNLPSPTPEKVLSICENFLIGVVVTPEEDVQLNLYRKAMPPAFDDPKSPNYRDPWLRYKLCNIELDC